MLHLHRLHRHTERRECCWMNMKTNGGKKTELFNFIPCWVSDCLLCNNEQYDGDATWFCIISLTHFVLLLLMFIVCCTELTNRTKKKTERERGGGDVYCCFDSKNSIQRMAYIWFEFHLHNHFNQPNGNGSTRAQYAFALQNVNGLMSEHCHKIDAHTMHNLLLRCGINSHWFFTKLICRQTIKRTQTNCEYIKMWFAKKKRIRIRWMEYVRVASELPLCAKLIFRIQRN